MCASVDMVTYRELDVNLASRLDLCFGVSKSLIEVNPGRVLLPPKYRDLGDRIRNMEVKPSDVWLISLPRTGSTWTQEMVWLIGNDLDYEKAKVLQPMRTPLLELSAVLATGHNDFIEEYGDSVDVVESLPSPRYIKTHLPIELLPKQLDTVKPKMVYVARNPKDMCVSYYHYCKLMHNLQCTFEEFCDMFLNGLAPFGPVWDHILGFWKRRNDPNFMFVKYEDMKRDQIGHIRETAEFMNKKINEEEILKLAEHLSFNKMKTNKSVNLEVILDQSQGKDYMKKVGIDFIRKGQVGDWRNHMSEEMSEKFDKWTEENLEGTGLSFVVD